MNYIKRESTKMKDNKIKQKKTKEHERKIKENGRKWKKMKEHEIHKERQ